MADKKNADLRNLRDEDFDTIIAHDMEFSGKISFSTFFLIKGCVRGTVDATGALAIDSTSRVEANIAAKKVLIRGFLKGNVVAESQVFICKGASVEGDIEADELVVEQGAFFSGNCKMRRK